MFELQKALPGVILHHSGIHDTYITSMSLSVYTKPIILCIYNTIPFLPVIQHFFPETTKKPLV